MRHDFASNTFQTHYEITAQTQIHPSLIQVHFPNTIQALNFYQTLFKPTASQARFLSQTLPNTFVATSHYTLAHRLHITIQAFTTSAEGTWPRAPCDSRSRSNTTASERRAGSAPGGSTFFTFRQTYSNSIQTPILGWKTQFKPIPN
jgi:hypothetical protein